MRWILAILTALGLAFAQFIRIPDNLEAEVGGFLSIPIAVNGSGEMTIQAPPVFQLLGGVQVEGGEALVNFLIDPEARAGIYLIKFSFQGYTRELPVRIAIKPGVELRAPSEGLGVLGERKTYTLVVRNTGNAKDKIRLSLDSILPGRFEPEVVELEPNQDAEVKLTLDLRGVGTGGRTVTVVATSSLDPTQKRFAGIRTEVEAFAGANQLTGPALMYRVNLGASYGNRSGPGFRVGANLGGGLSDFVVLGSSAEISNTGGSGALGISTQSWAAGYRVAGDSQRLEGLYGPWQGFVTFGQAGFAVGVGFEERPWRFGLTYTPQLQILRAGTVIDLGAGLDITPFLALTGRPVTGGYDIRPGAGAELRYQNADFSLSNRLEYLEGGLIFSASASTRLRDPLGASGELVISTNNLLVALAFNQRISQELNLTQRVVYSGTGITTGNLGAAAGVEYAPSGLPLRFGLQAGGQFQRGVFRPSASFGVGYRQGPFDLGAQVGWLNDDYALAASLAFRPDFYGFLVSYSRSASANLLTLGAELEWENFIFGAGYSFDLLSRGSANSTNLSLAYRTAEGHSVSGKFGIGQSLNWEVAGNYAIAGGFTTPEPLVSALGGRSGGTLEGIVFVDQDRNGIRNLDDPILAEATVKLGNQEVKTDANGRYSISVPAGSYRVGVGGMAAEYGLRRRLEISLGQGTRLERDIPVETVVSVTGVVMDDVNRSGNADGQAKPLPYARVTIRSQDGESASTVADDRGAFLFQNLVPGSYTLTLDPASLPRLYEVTAGSKQVVLQPGPMPRVSLFAASVVREVEQTLNASDLTIRVMLGTNTTPPGADLEIRVEVSGETEEVTAEGAGNRVALKRDSSGLYRGWLRVPEQTTGIFPVTISARRNQEKAEQLVNVVVRPGPLAQLSMTPALVDPRKPMDVQAVFLQAVKSVYVLIGDQRYELTADPENPYLFKGSVYAPADPGVYEPQLWADGRQWASGRFRVDTP